MGVVGGTRWQLTVSAGGDALRQERLTRDLHDTLRDADGLIVGISEDKQPPALGRKGAGAGEVALWAATTAAVAHPAARVLIALVREWCARDRHRAVEVTYRGNSVRITGRPDAAQERVIRDFLDRAADDGGTPPGDGTA